MRIADEVPEAEAEIDLVSDEVQRLDRVVRTFLDLNRPMELDIKEFDPAELAASVLEVMRTSGHTGGRGTAAGDEPGPFTVQADRGLIEQGLLNIVNNAIQALASGATTDRVVRTAVALNHGNCEIAVTDNGPGMPVKRPGADIRALLHTKASGQGSAWRSRSEQWNFTAGRSAVTSAPGQGTTMILSFPVSRGRR